MEQLTASENVNAAAWTPAFELNLETASASDFEELIEKFKAWSLTQKPLGPLNLKNGWHTVTPAMAEEFLRRNKANRKASLATVKKYYLAMKKGAWKRTGQALIFDTESNAVDLQHRALACYLGRVSFETAIFVEASPESDLFAYIDDSRARTAADALYTSGENGLSGTIAGAIKLAWRYDNNAFGILRQARIRELSVIEVLAYAREHPTLGEVAHRVMGTYPKAAALLGKPVAVFFAWKAFASNETLADSFLGPLGSGANLAEDSPILALRNRLNALDERDPDNKLNPSRRLALVIKAFKAFVAGKKMGKGGLYVRDNEKFPRFEAQFELPSEASEASEADEVVEAVA